MEIILLPYEHLARGCEIACGEEIHTTRHRFTKPIFAIPIHPAVNYIQVETRGST